MPSGRRWATALLVAAAMAAAMAAALSRAADPAPPGSPAALGHALADAGATLRAALDRALPDTVAIVDLEAGYLADQGGLLIVDLAAPWYRRDDAARADAVDAALADLEQIPDQVHQMLDELDLGLSRHQVAELQTLRELRGTLQQLRGERRELRARLRTLQRQRLGVADSAEIDNRIVDLERQLAAATARQQALERDIDAIRHNPLTRPGRALPAATRAQIDRAVAEMLCDHGELFAALEATARINVVVRAAPQTRYLVFPMDRVRGCDHAAALLQDSVSY